MSIIYTETPKGTYLVIRGRAIWPKITKPDTKFTPEGAYSCKLALSAEDKDALQAILEEAQQVGVQMAVEEAAKKGKKVAADKVKLADLPLVELLDKETGEGTDEYAVSAKAKASGTRKDGSTWTRAVKIFDAKLKPVNPETVEIWSDSVLAMRVQLRPFYVPALGAGVSLRLEAVQILTLNSGGDRDGASYGFGEEEDGWSPDENGGATPWGNDASGETSTEACSAGPEDF